MLNTEKREGRRLRSPFWIWYTETVQKKETNPIASHTTLLSVGNVSSVKGQKKGKKRLKASQDSFISPQGRGCLAYPAMTTSHCIA